MNVGWIDPGLLRDFQTEGTNAHRLCTIEHGWVERFGSDVLISFKKVLARERLLEELQTWADSVGLQVRRVFARPIPRESERREPPALIVGDPSESLQTVATEWSLRFGIDFGTGYSPGLFLDQRENRRYVRNIAPRRLLNCFAYTCSFSVYAACNGASTLNIDLSKKYLTRGRENFALNNLSTIDHRFILDDVRSVLPRLARRGEKFDAIILDIMLPKLSGYDLAHQLRKEKVATPVLMLTAKDSVPDLVRGLDSGADDYLTKPFAFEELLARLRAVKRRAPVPQATKLQVGNLVLDPATREVSRGGRDILLTRTEYNLLERLMYRVGKVVPRRSLIEAVWGFDRDIEENTLDAFVRLLRTKIDTEDQPKLIHTVRGVGYMIRAEVQS